VSSVPQTLFAFGDAAVPDGIVRQGLGGQHRHAWHVRLKTLHGGRSEGVRVIEIDNGAMVVDVLPTRGMGVWRVRRGDHTLGWRAPALAPVHPAFVPLMEPSGLGWLDGFSELLCRCGLESNGAPEFDDKGRLTRPLHGRIANTPAHHVELVIDEQAGILTVRGIVDESRFHFQSLRLSASLTTAFGGDSFSWHDEVTNEGGRDATMQMLYHFNLGQPLLQPGARIAAPIAAIAPLTPVAAARGIDTWNIMPPPEPGSAEQVYVAELAAGSDGETRALVAGLTDDAAVSLRFNVRELPCFTVWRNSPDDADGYVLGLEPGTNYPNPRSFEEKHGRVVSLKPGEQWTANVAVTWHADRSSTAPVQAAIDAIQQGKTPAVSPQPRDDWSATS
jgi:galactose mutarotase-like enzyme